MKRRIIILVCILLLVITFSTKVFALKGFSNTQRIKIDCNFDDWRNKPYYIDYKHDIKSTELNFLMVKYFTDDEYLYLYVERQSAKKSKPWDFQVIILNAEKGKEDYEEIPTQYKYYKKHNYYRPYKFEEMGYVSFDISSNYDNYKGHKGIPVKISMDGEVIETTLSASNNSKSIEFRIPLEKVGLDGPNKEIKFMLKSGYDKKAKKQGEYPYDWVPNGKPIIITTGPTYWQSSSIIFFIAVSFISYRIYRKRISKIKPIEIS